MHHNTEPTRGSESELVARAVHALGSHRPRLFDDVTVELATRCATGVGAHAVVATVVTLMRDAVRAAWERGWQPSDIQRMGARTLTAPEQEVARDVMADELDRYAAQTVDPRWLGQLTAIESRIWWQRSQTWLDARRRSGTDWLTLVTQSMAVLHLVQTLPSIERLTPLPGEVRPAQDGNGSAGDRRATLASVDVRVLERVRMLLAKAESTTFEAEAETFTAGAQALMARHSIDAALLAASAGEESAEDGPQGRRIGIESPYEGPKASLLSAVASANRCRTVWTKELGFGTVIGYEADLESVELLFTSLLVQANARMLAEGKRADFRGRSRTRAFRSSFLTAYAHRIGERLREVAKAEMESAAPEASSKGQALVPLLAARNKKVEQTVGEWFPSLTRRRTQPVRDAEGWHIGRAAADQASLDGTAPRDRVGRRRTG
ncbi:DUF2786 domain-containing protein [Knoellia sinensis]|nr:DUF2786 domain-containing protein [Knoellia sinensis]